MQVTVGSLLRVNIRYLVQNAEPFLLLHLNKTVRGTLTSGKLVHSFKISIYTYILYCNIEIAYAFFIKTQLWLCRDKVHHSIYKKKLSDDVSFILVSNSYNVLTN